MHFLVAAAATTIHSTIKQHSRRLIRIENVVGVVSVVQMDALNVYDDVVVLLFNTCCVDVAVYVVHVVYAEHLHYGGSLLWFVHHFLPLLHLS